VTTATHGRGRWPIWFALAGDDITYVCVARGYGCGFELAFEPIVHDGMPPWLPIAESGVFGFTSISNPSSLATSNHRGTGRAPFVDKTILPRYMMVDVLNSIRNAKEYEKHYLAFSG